MNRLLAFSPFVAFVIIERVFGIFPGLAAGAIIALLMLLRDFVDPARLVKHLEIGTAFLFTVLAAYAFFNHVQWSIAAVRLRVDGGLTLIFLISIVLRQPFTLQYAREKSNRTQWDNARFLRVNYVISAAWTVAFAMLTFADLFMVYVPQLPHSAGIILSVIAIAAALGFTSWYPQVCDRKPFVHEGN
jgi:hypothetical protein